MNQPITIADVIDFQAPLTVWVETLQVLVGTKKAVYDGRKLYISPAMFALMKDLQGDELEKVLKAIPVMYMPVPDPAKMFAPVNFGG